MADKPAKRGPRPQGHDTRGAIVAAARIEFANKGYEAASMRAVARAAKVDPALVHHYFDSKVDLFAATADLDVNIAERAANIVSGPKAESGERLLRGLLWIWSTPERQLRMRALLSTAISSADSDPRLNLIQKVLLDDLVGKYCEQLGVDQPQRRAALIVTQTLGLAVMRFVVDVPAIRELSDDELVKIVAPTIQRYLYDELPD